MDKIVHVKCAVGTANTTGGLESLASNAMSVNSI